MQPHRLIKNTKSLKMKKIFKIAIALLLITLFISCEEDVTSDITLNSIERLVIEGGIERNESNTNQTIRLTKTAPYLTNDANPGVTDATVVVADGTNSWVFNHVGNGNYSNTSLLPETGKTYTITITWNGETYSGSDTLNEVPVFDKFYYKFEAETLFTDEGYFLKFDSTDPSGVANYYYYRTFKNDVYTIVPDPGNSQTLIVSDKFFDGQQRIGVNPNEEVAFKIDDMAKAQQLGISKKYYDYLYQLFEQTGNQGISFVGNPPPASIRSNIINVTNPSNRILGFFYSVDVEENSVLIE